MSENDPLMPGARKGLEQLRAMDAAQEPDVREFLSRMQQQFLISLVRKFGKSGGEGLTISLPAAFVDENGAWTLGISTDGNNNILLIARRKS